MSKKNRVGRFFTWDITSGRMIFSASLYFALPLNLAFWRYVINHVEITGPGVLLLKAHPGWESGLLYVSDHGQSLGENGIYLHGLPYGVAPKEQTRVPMILWMSETMKREDHIDYACLKARAGAPLSQ